MKKIIIVDDDPDILEVVNIILMGGFNVPEIVDEYHPDLGLLDIRLPGKQGTEICRDLRFTSYDLPIILFSANTLQKKSLICVRHMAL